MNSDSSIRPLVSVIIAVKNGERFLASAIQSVLAQDYRPLEIVLVDGQSTDGTAGIARSFSEVRYFLQLNTGVADAYNLGLEQAQGEFITFLSHDDMWMPDKLTNQIGYLTTHPEIQYAVCRVKFFIEPGCEMPAGFRPELLQQEPVAYIMETLAVHRQVFNQVGRFDPALSPADDVDWYARVFDADVPGYVVPRVLLYKRIHQANTSLVTLNNNQLLLAALRRSVWRKRRKGVSNESCSG